MNWRENKMEYKNFYAFEVIGELMNGTQIFAVDKKTNFIYELQSLPMSAICEVLKIAREQDRVIFYNAKESEDNINV
jgi:hypothetical protein